MKPEDIDKLFHERLGHSSPTPPSDLWNRLQERMEEELPVQEPEQERSSFTIWMHSYAAAAVITLLLTVGVAFYMTKERKLDIEETAIAQVNPNKQVEPTTTAEVAPGAAGDTYSATETPEQGSQSSTAERKGITSPAVTGTTSAVAKVVKPAPETKNSQSIRTEPKNVPEQALAISQVKPQAPEQLPIHIEVLPPTPVASAKAEANMSAAPVEIIIKRSSEPLAASQNSAEREQTGFEKKQRLAKSIFKQVANLSNGERVELSELGINANKIALETQIGKQKISKVINL